MKYAILIMAVVTVYPSMIQLRASKMRSELEKKVWENVVGLVIIFVVAPLLAMFLADFISQREVGVGFVASNTVPASSASLSYVLLAEGNIEFATLLALISIFGALVFTPFYVGLYASKASISLPLGDLVTSIVVALVLPLILGQLTRYYLVDMRARTILHSKDYVQECKEIKNKMPSSFGDVFEWTMDNALRCLKRKIDESLKPYLSLVTIVSTLILVFLLIANKGYLLVKMPITAAEIIGFQLVTYGVLIILIILVSKLTKMKYEDHVALAFMSITKNQSVAAAMAVMAIGATAALPAALIPMIQPVVAVGYLEVVSRRLKRSLEGA